MKTAYIGIPAHGHTNPTLPVMRELVAARASGAVLQCGVVPRGRPRRRGRTSAPTPSHFRTSAPLLRRSGEINTASRLLAGDERAPDVVHAEEMARERPDVILYDSVAMWGYLARTRRLPHICSITHFVLDGSQRSVGVGEMARYIWTALPHVPALMRWKRRMTRRYGKGVVGGITEYGDLNLVFTSREFHPPNRFVDERFCFVGPSIDPAMRAGDDALDFAFNTIGDGPVVYLSLGTISNVNPLFYRTAFEAFGGYPARFILAAGQRTDLADLGPIPANFVVRQYAPQLAILQRAQAFIAHGGLNSVHEGLYYGVPETHQLEQALNGKRVAETGAGVLRAALDAVLSKATYRDNAPRIGETLSVAGGYVRAAGEIETFAQVISPQPM